MTIAIPSYHKDGRNISPMWNRPDTHFFIRPSQKDYYKETFPLVILHPDISDDVEIGQLGLAHARNAILNWWRNFHPKDEEWLFVPDDDVNKFYITDTYQKNVKVNKRLVTPDEAFEKIISYADKNTTVIGPTGNDKLNALSSKDVDTNHSRASDGCVCISCNAVGNYITEYNTWENQYFAGLQMVHNKNWKVVYRVGFRTLPLKHSINFSPETVYEKSRRFAENTLKSLPPGIIEFKERPGINGIPWFALTFPKQKEILSPLGFRFSN
jgi:hypothetical protein